MSNINAKPPRWNYEPCKAVLGTVKVVKSERETWWCAKLEGHRLKCVKVMCGNSSFFINNEDGSGFRKVFEQGGGPDSYHASIPVDDPDSFRQSPDQPKYLKPKGKQKATRPKFPNRWRRMRRTGG